MGIIVAEYIKKLHYVRGGAFQSERNENYEKNDREELAAERRMNSNREKQRQKRQDLNRSAVNEQKLKVTDFRVKWVPVLS